MTRPVVLVILDGWGLREDTFANAPALAATPCFDRLWSTCPHATLVTHGRDAGLPAGQMGNSEVGHTNIGAGRVVAMDLGQIDLAIEDGSWGRNEALDAFAAALLRSGGTAHLIGVASDGGVHGHVLHLIHAARGLAARGIPVAVHALTDGRDVPPGSAGAFLRQIEEALPPGARLATVDGRYWAMDRDRRWDRVRLAYDAIARGVGLRAPDAAAALAQAAARGETDEFVTPTVLGDYGGMQPGDGVFCLNFRADRARELLQALADPDFTGWERGEPPPLAARLGLVDYSAAHDAWYAAMFPKRPVANTLGEWVSAHGRTQFRLAETEKYPHVTFFLNGGREAPFPGEDRLMPPSPKVATYDLQPEMAAPAVTEALVAAIRRPYDLVVCNYANPDMVGHTGDLSAAIRACEAVDRGLARAVEAVQAMGGAMIVTADHGNCELMMDPATGGPHTAHTLNPVPVILVGGPEGAQLRSGRLADLAPTVLDLMGLAPPPEMTGHSLIERAT
ncbi:2,3-bisphosphoglycerate-independent phosphoglycerate mutase [Rubellimicrobium sp. CFH 75288]|uniref:2,3-bisphosphoglycerate-independent phosphoglycerate mutase n=1 Tax=Rubellimicrobium sp. CFH 75288 TaxID=2697034 RepID=UPI0014133B45|nr:2,3-bisphosphoglycerate-independent phosphoglycerate mutase [Rubellimicrobium sp. CFH 75288]NAZ38296.1 2,3-bisphosphoglycerate-independent phosphoglycerate mutase [Rubellimicrobium sp. CFH 75288]